MCKICNNCNLEARSMDERYDSYYLKLESKKAKHKVNEKDRLKIEVIPDVKDKLYFCDKRCLVSYFMKRDGELKDRVMIYERY